MGQSLYRPPTVKGWAGGRHWINTATMVRRHNLIAALLEADGPYGGKLDPRRLAQQHGYSTPESASRFLADLLVQSDLSGNASLTADDDGDSLRRVAQTIMTTPEFQLA
jgi:hypothetical protein